MAEALNERSFRGGMHGLAFGAIGGSIAGCAYVVQVGLDASIAWTSLLVHAYTIAWLAGAVPMAAIAAARGYPMAPLLRISATVVTGALAGAFGATRIATLPGTPYPGPVLALATLSIAVIGFSVYAQPRDARRAQKALAAVAPIFLVVPIVIGVEGALDERGALGLDAMRLRAEALGLLGLGLVGGSVAGLGVGALVELSVLVGRALERLSELAANREDVAERS